MADIAMQIKMTARAKNISATGLLQKCGLNKNFLVYMAGGTVPSLDSIIKIADELDVSIDYLVGRTDNPGINRG